MSHKTQENKEKNSFGKVGMQMSLFTKRKIVAESAKNSQTIQKGFNLCKKYIFRGHTWKVTKMFKSSSRRTVSNIY